MLYCNICKQEKSYRCFPFNSSRRCNSRKHRAKTCIVCYKNDPWRLKCYNNLILKNKETKEQLLQWIDRIKQNGCKFCGYNKCHAALEFHHLKKKKFSISWAIKNLIPKRQIRHELRRCILLCANCHREEHRQNYNKILDKLFTFYIDY